MCVCARVRVRVCQYAYMCVSMCIRVCASGRMRACRLRGGVFELYRYPGSLLIKAIAYMLRTTTAAGLRAIAIIHTDTRLMCAPDTSPLRAARHVTSSSRLLAPVLEPS